MKVLSAPLDKNNLIDSLNAKITDNQHLPNELKLNDALLATVLLTKLPPRFNSLRDIVIDKDDLPTPKQLITKVRNTIEFESIKPSNHPNQPIAFAALGPYCFNCANQYDPSLDTCIKAFVRLLALRVPRA